MAPTMPIQNHGRDDSSAGGVRLGAITGVAEDAPSVVPGPTGDAGDDSCGVECLVSSVGEGLGESLPPVSVGASPGLGVPPPVATALGAVVVGSVVVLMPGAAVLVDDELRFVLRLTPDDPLPDPIPAAPVVGGGWAGGRVLA